MSIDPGAQMNYVDEEPSSGSGDDVNIGDGHNKRMAATASGSGRRKRGRRATGDAIVEAMLEIAAASKMRAAAMIKNEDRFSISKCIKALDDMQGVDQQTYFLALDLFENPNAREIFISLKNEKRLQWLLGKYSSANRDDIDIELDEMELVAAAAGYYYYCSLIEQPQSGLPLARCSFMKGLLEGPDDGFREMLRMDKHVFHKLSDTLRRKGMLRDTAGVLIEEQLAIFLSIVGHNERNRVIQERFHHSGETVSRHFKNTLKAIKSMSREFLQTPYATTPSEIVNSKRFYPYFKDCIGAIDGLQIRAHVPAKDQCRFQNKKGVLTQNVLAACTFDLQFIFVYPGWEGSVPDSRVLKAVLDDPNQNFPQVPAGKYYLVDRGYTNTEGFIAPYPGVRYYLHEYTGASQLPQNARELFNHRHSCLSNVIHRSFNILKTRFPTLKSAPQYAFHIQRDLVIAVCVMHNFVRREERNDWLFAGVEGVPVEHLPDQDEELELLQLNSAPQEQIAAAQRESIAVTMWDDFMNKWDEW